MSEKNNATIQSRMDELQELLGWFDSDEFKLEQATEKYQAAMKLADAIEKDLMTLKNDVQVLKQKFEE